ncbi:MAG: heavy metal translocating P-type ATPase [Prevotella sp.]|nr:heavy metal translocating P-type ATPase [Prevotella sp.]
MSKVTIPVVGMACSSCSAHVEKKLNSLEGVKSASVSLSSRSALVEYDPSIITLQQMKEAINGIGFDLVIEQDRSVEEIERREYTLLKRKTLLAWVFAVSVMVVGNYMKDGAQLALILSLASILTCGKSFYVNAWKQLRHGMASMDTLVCFSTAISFGYSAVVTLLQVDTPVYFDASVMIIAFVLLGRLLEERAKRTTASSIRTLMGLRPKTARIVRDGEFKEFRNSRSLDNSIQSNDAKVCTSEPLETPEPLTMDVPLSTIAVSDVLEVRAGERIPVDGMVTWADSFMTAGGAYVDESMITGEPTPLLKKRFSKVLAGTVLQQGTLRFRATQVGEKTALAQIISMVQQAQGSKAPVQRVVDRLSMIFVPTVAALSLLTFIVWMIVGGEGALSHAIISAVAVLVIACPCAMGLATPTALMVGIGKAAERNILVKDATAIELMRKVNALVIDKTGTLTIPNQDIDFTKADNLPYEERETLKPHAQEAMSQLQQVYGIDVYMMSGDREDAAAYWAGKAGISHWKSGVKPQDKENLVRQLQQEGKVVAMVGDGINDSQALATADVSIAIGTGTDVAMDVAQVTLMGNDLRALPNAVSLSRRTVSMIHQNLFWAFIYNMVCIPLAAGLPYAFGIDFQITPMWASALMALSSVSVVLNSLRLRLVHSS